MDRETEVQLVGRLRAGDPAAFDAVHAAFNARVYNFLARLSNRRDVAEDLLEETWLRLVVYAPRLRPDTRLGPWLFTVARNLHTSHCRSRLLEDSHAAGLLGLWPGGSPGPSPFEEAEASEAQGRLATALASLPAAYREVLLLVAVEGLRPAEAAEVCGITGEATLRSPGARRRICAASARARTRRRHLRSLCRLALGDCVAAAQWGFLVASRPQPQRSRRKTSQKAPSHLDRFRPSSISLAFPSVHTWRASCVSAASLAPPHGCGERAIRWERE